MSNVFDPAKFVDLQVTESNDTKLIPIPAGEFTGLAEKAEVRAWKSADGTKSGLAVDISWVIDDPAVKGITQRDKNTARQSVMLDLNEQGGLDMGKGKNVGLGRLREALNLNAAGAPFSIRMIEGKAAKVSVIHEPNEKDPDSGPYVKVNRVAKLG